jgi:hypothetical protein
VAPLDLSVSDGSLSLKADQAQAGNGNGGRGGGGGKGGGGRGGGGKGGGKGGGHGGGKGGAKGLGNGLGGFSGFASKDFGQGNKDKAKNKGQGFGKTNAKGLGNSIAEGLNKSFAKLGQSVNEMGLRVNKLGKVIGQDRAAWAQEWAGTFGNLNAFRSNALDKVDLTQEPVSNVEKIAAYDAARKTLMDANTTLADYGLDQAEIDSLAGLDATEIETAIEDGTVTVNEGVMASDIEGALATQEIGDMEAQTAFDDAAKKNYSDDEAAAVRAELDTQLSIQHGDE